ncbi:MAG: GNAT family N-acetyltransferase [Armatimonadota bacterium]
MQLTVRELSEAEYPLWDALVAVSPQRTIFAQRWWMEVATDGGGRLLGCFNGDRLVAGMPIWPCRTLGVRRLRQPPLTPYWGPLLRPLEGKPQKRSSTEMHILRALAEALAPWPDINTQWHHSLANWLPFYWNQFTQSTRYTYRIPDLSDLGCLEKACHDAVGQQLRAARRAGLQIEDMVDPEVVARLNRLSMARQGTGGSEELYRRWQGFARAAGERNCLFTTAAVDAEGNIHAAMGMVWDDRCAYALVNGADPAFHGSYATTLTLWREIEYAAGVVPEFDFEGSMVESVEQFYRRFGGTLQPYLHISRFASRKLNLMRGVQAALQNRPGRKERKEKKDEAAS